MKVFCIEDRERPFVNAFVRSATDAGFSVVRTPGERANPEFLTFLQSYRHSSVNSSTFELACFFRYFAILALVGDESPFVIADSDVIVNMERNVFREAIEQFPHTLIASRGIAGGRIEKQVSPHFSVWTKPVLRHFVTYLCDRYRRAAAGDLPFPTGAVDESRGSVSDMTLLGAFVEDTGQPFLNSNSVRGHFPYIDHNISMRWVDGVEFETRFGVKTLHRAPGGRVAYKAVDGRLITPGAIHLQGRAKIACPEVYRGQLWRANVKLGLLGSIRRVRCVLA